MKAWNPEREMEYGLFRIPIPEFSEVAFREGLINAFCHRDYSILQMVRLAIEDEGMSISSPGGFIDGVNLNNLLTVEPHGRNQALADALKRIGLAERTGRGIDRIFEGSIVYGRPLPDYSESTSRYVKLFIQRAEPDLEFTRMISNEENRMGRMLPINSLLILSVLQLQRRATIHELSEAIHVGEQRIKANIEKLIESGLVEAVGSGKTRMYILSAKVYKSQDNVVGYVRQTGIDRLRHNELVLQLAKQQEYITRENVCELLGADKYWEVTLGDDICNDISEFDFNVEVIIGFNLKLETYKVTLKMVGEKSGEYRLNISLTGFFSFDSEELRDDNLELSQWCFPLSRTLEEIKKSSKSFS